MLFILFRSLFIAILFAKMPNLEPKQQENNFIMNTQKLIKKLNLAHDHNLSRNGHNSQGRFIQ